MSSIFKYIKSLYNDFMELYGLVKLRQSSYIKAFFVTCGMIINVTSQYYLPSEKASIKQIENGVYELQFQIRHRDYRYIIKPSRLPPPMIVAVNQDGEDITDKIIPYMGPMYDWYGRDPPLAKHMGEEEVDILWNEKVVQKLN
jgi:hypothetical protein